MINLFLSLLVFISCAKTEIETFKPQTITYDSSKVDYIPSNNGQVVKHTEYTLSYIEEHEQPEWVAYMLTEYEVKLTLDRTDDFRVDPLITTGSATVDDYKNSGYDKGHLSPAADNRISKTVMSECFYMSNMSPQVPQFNRGIWSKLEEQVRTWAIKFDTVYVITGPILEEGLPKIGPSGVSVPEYYYKVLLVNKDTYIALILPNEGSKLDLSTFVVSIDYLESVTKIDFFPNMKIREDVINLQGWFK